MKTSGRAAKRVLAFLVSCALFIGENGLLVEAYAMTGKAASAGRASAAPQISSVVAPPAMMASAPGNNTQFSAIGAGGAASLGGSAVKLPVGAATALANQPAGGAAAGAASQLGGLPAGILPASNPGAASASLPSGGANPAVSGVSAVLTSAGETGGAPGAISGLTAMDAANAPGGAGASAQETAYDGRKTQAAAVDSIGALPADKITAYLVRAGHSPISVTLAQLPQALAAQGFSAAFNKNGHVRLVLAEGQTERTLLKSDAEAVAGVLRGNGLIVDGKRSRTEGLYVNLQAPVQAPAGAPSASASAANPAASPARTSLRLSPQTIVRGAVAAATAAVFFSYFGTGNLLAMAMLAALISNIDRLVRETAYALGMLKISFKDSGRPKWNEILGGIGSKVIPAVINIGVFLAMYKGHPVALALAVALSLAVETFHGVWVNAWDTFQSKIGRDRGMLYQNIFNFAYGLLISGSYRTIAFLTLGNVAPPWALAFWKDMSLMTIIGTFCGTLGYRGLNSLYEKGRVPRWGRASIQQLRDFCMMMVGPFFATGNMFMTWLLFGIMQSVDLILYAIDRNTQTRPIVYIADERVAQSEAFRKMYIEKSSPLTDALNGVKGFILFKPLIALYRMARAKFGRPAGGPGGRP